MTRPRSAALLNACALGLAGWLATDAWRQVQLGIADAGLWFVVCATPVGLAAVVAIGRWPDRRRMAWLVLFWLTTAVTDDLGVDWSASRVAVTASLLAQALQAPAYAQMALAYPTGYARDRLERAFLALAYPVSLLWMAFPALFSKPPRPHAPSLLFTGTTIDLTPIGNTFAATFIALGIAFIALIIRRLHQSPHGASRTLLPLAAAGLFAAAQLVVLRIAWLTHWDRALATLDWLGRVNLLVLPIAVGAGVATIRRHRGPLGDLVVQLAAARPAEIRTLLAKAIGDPSLELVLWLPEQQRFVDEHGSPVDVSHNRPGRAVTQIGPSHEPLAAVIHDASLIDQRPLLEAAGTAARLALENARLQAELRAQLAELQQSRARLVAAGDSERRRLERDLHDGAQQRLLALGLALQLLRDNNADAQLLAEAEAELQAALRELRQLARGIHPAILTDQGLKAAIGSLADRGTLPISTLVADQRYPPAVESAAYFIVAEALTNTAKHANARSASVTITPQNGTLVIEVTDDGAGGAQPGTEGGLQGLADRVGALSGRLTISSQPDAGTTIRAEIPCASS